MVHFREPRSTLTAISVSTTMSSSLTPPKSPFSRLPTEILLEIFRLAADSSLSCARALTLVASWTTHLGRTALYNTVVLRSPTRVATFINALSPKKKDFKDSKLPRTLRERAMLMHDLWFAGGTTRAEAWHHVRLFDACANVTNYALPTSYLRPFLESKYHFEPADPSTLRQPPCRQLTLITETFRYDWQQYTDSLTGQWFLSGLTHLCILEMRTSHYLPLDSLPNLTHLALPLSEKFVPQADIVLVGILAQSMMKFKNLAMVVLLFDLYNRKGLTASDICGLVDQVRNREERLYVLPLEDRNHSRALWEEGARGRLSLWDRAAQVRDDCGHMFVAEVELSSKPISRFVYA